MSKLRFNDPGNFDTKDFYEKVKALNVGAVRVSGGFVEVALFDEATKSDIDNVKSVADGSFLAFVEEVAETFVTKNVPPSSIALSSPDGTSWNVSVGNDGTLSTAKA